MTRAKDISKIVTDADLSGTLDVTGDLTVDTNTLHVDSTNNRVGIGTSPATILHIKESSPIFTQETTGNVTTSGVAYQQVKDVSGSSVFTQGFAGLANCYQFGTSISNGFMRFLTGSAVEAMRIDSSGRTGIGITDNFRGFLNVFNGDDFNTATNGNCDNIYLVSDATSGDNVYGASIAFSRVQYPDRRGAAIASVQTGSDEDNVGLAFFTHPSTTSGDPIVEAMRIDSSGNLLVGTTDSSPENNSTGTSADNGLALTPYGYGSFSRYAANSGTGIPLFVNRTNADGVLVQFRKDGGTVGSIGVASSDLTIFSTTGNHKGLRFGNAQIVPTNNAGADSDNTTDLGGASNRFKDLYLSGGAYIGGTGSANKLDDYEEGSLSLSVATGTASFSYARYTKVGNLVTIRFNINTISDQSTASNLLVTGLPFTSTPANQSASGILSRYFNGGGDGYIAYISASQSQVQFFQTVNNGNYHQVRHSDLTSTNANAFVTISYEAQ